jgi:hypothetical protein
MKIFMVVGQMVVGGILPGIRDEVCNRRAVGSVHVVHRAATTPPRTTPRSAREQATSNRSRDDMRHDFSMVQESETDLVTVPPGEYLCRVREVRVRRTKDGAHEQWALCLEVAEGEHAGHFAAWDNLTFSDKGLPRVKLALRALGEDVGGVVEIEGPELAGRDVVCQLLEQSYTDPHSGNITRRLGVPYAGYSHPAAGRRTSGSGAGAAAGRELHPF